MQGWWFVAGALSISAPTEQVPAVSGDSWIPSPFAFSVDAPAAGDWRVRYELAEDQNVSLSLVDELGRPVVELVDAFERAGEHAIAWDASGERNLARVKFARLAAGAFIETVSVRALP